MFNLQHQNDTPKSNFVSALEHFWNSWCSARKDVLLIICASATSWIINKFIKESGGDPAFWSHSLNSGVHRAWSGLAFERVCLQHVGQIKAALGIAGVMTKQCAWRSDQKNLGPGERGAQIDLLIDRRDDTINICEMKWASEPYVIDKDYDEKLRNKVAAFIRETGTRKSILISMVTTYGVKENMYSDAVQSQVVMDDLFA